MSDGEDLEAFEVDAAGVFEGVKYSALDIGVFAARFTELDSSEFARELENVSSGHVLLLNPMMNRVSVITRAMVGKRILFVCKNKTARIVPTQIAKIARDTKRYFIRSLYHVGENQRKGL